MKLVSSLVYQSSGYRSVFEIHDLDFPNHPGRPLILFVSRFGESKIYTSRPPYLGVAGTGYGRWEASALLKMSSGNQTPGQFLKEFLTGNSCQWPRSSSRAGARS